MTMDCYQKFQNFMKRSAWIFITLILLLLPSLATAETLSWYAVTTYTDGTTITVPVTYTAVWSTNSSMASPTTLVSSASSLSTFFNVTTAGMTRGSTVYFAVRAIVGGVSSAYSAPLSWLVPNLAPSPPSNLRIQ